MAVIFSSWRSIVYIGSEDNRQIKKLKIVYYSFYCSEAGQIQITNNVHG